MTRVLAASPDTGGAVIDINAASLEQLAQLPGLDARKARLICERRPFAHWNEVQRLEGFGEEIVNRLKASRAEIRKL